LPSGEEDKRKEAYDRIWFAEAGRECFADIVDSTVFRPCCGDDWVEVLFTNKLFTCEIEGKEDNTLAFGGAAFGLQASFTTLS
jgi:hypothetical protein